MRRAAGITHADSMTVRSYFSFDRTRDLKDAGVKLLAGTDMPQAFVYPGFSLHDELGLLVEAGLTPLQSLQTATVNPAQFLGIKDMGTIAPGTKANLVLLDANPVEDIANTKRISAVIMRGTLYRRNQLDELLNQSAQIAASRTQ